MRDKQLVFTHYSASGGFNEYTIFEGHGLWGWAYKSIGMGWSCSFVPSSRAVGGFISHDEALEYAMDSLRISGWDVDHAVWVEG